MNARRLLLTADDGRRLEVAVAGAQGGDLVICHHGTPGCAGEFWPPDVEEATACGLLLACYSRPGGAGSERDPGRDVAACARDTAVVADALDADRFLTLGGSGGGPHALACAALLPDRVIAAAAIAGVAPRRAEGLDWLAGMGEENVQEFAAADAGPAELEDFLNQWLPRLREVTGDEVLASLGELISPPDARVLTGEYADHAAANMRDALSSGIWGWFDDDMAFVRDWGFELASIEVPVSIWQGRQDQMVPLPHGEWLAANVPGARVHLLEDHGHLSLALAHFGAILDELVAAGQSST